MKIYLCLIGLCFCSICEAKIRMYSLAQNIDILHVSSQPNQQIRISVNGKETQILSIKNKFLPERLKVKKIIDGYTEQLFVYRRINDSSTDAIWEDIYAINNNKLVLIYSHICHLFDGGSARKYATLVTEKFIPTSLGKAKLVKQTLMTYHDGDALPVKTEDINLYFNAKEFYFYKE